MPLCSGVRISACFHDKPSRRVETPKLVQALLGNSKGDREGSQLHEGDERRVVVSYHSTRLNHHRTGAPTDRGSYIAEVQLQLSLGEPRTIRPGRACSSLNSGVVGIQGCPGCI